MKLLQTLILLAVFASAILALARMAVRKAGSGKTARVATYTTTLLLAVAVGTLQYVMAPTEERVVWGSDVSEQHVVLGEGQGFGYLRGMVLVPASLPLPAFSGVLVAVAPEGARLVTTREGNSLKVTAISLLDDQAVAPVCGNQRALGVTLEFDAVLPACPTL